GCAREVLRTADRGSRRHVPEALGAAGIRAADDPHRCPFGEYPDRAEEARGDADLRAVRDHRLLGLAAAIGIENVEGEVMRVEQAGLVADLGDEGLADAAPADRDLELILGASRF